jgi:hypothetical protein
MKLTLVSILYRGVRYSRFIMLPINEGKASLPHSKLNEILQEIGVQAGTTYSIGY